MTCLLFSMMVILNSLLVYIYTFYEECSRFLKDHLVDFCRDIWILLVFRLWTIVTNYGITRWMGVVFKSSIMFSTLHLTTNNYRKKTGLAHKNCSYAGLLLIGPFILMFFDQSYKNVDVLELWLMHGQVIGRV